MATRFFLESSKKWPDRPAIDAGSWACKYLDLDLASARIAERLRQVGITGENELIVALRAPRGAFVYAAVLGVLRAGAAYVYIDPDFPEERATFMIEDCDAVVVLTEGDMTVRGQAQNPKMPSPDVIGSRSMHNTHTMDNIWRPRDDTDGKWEDINIPDSRLAYVIYTSGSTGKPKGVLLEHGSLCLLIDAEKELYKATQEDRVLQGFSLSFDASVEELWVAWAAGACLVLGSPEMMRLGPDLAHELNRKQISILSTVPTLLKTMDEPESLQVRILILGGEALSQKLVDTWATGRQMFNTYGPTEATVICTATQVQQSRCITIGGAIQGYDVYVMDDVLQEVKLSEGAEGQLVVGGRAVARGYLNRPDATEKAFVGHPTRGRVYLTGDVVRWTDLPNAEGGKANSWELLYVGRVDSQVKVRGFRVELGEVERTGAACPGVSDIAVVVLSNSEGEKSLHAFASGTATAADLEGHLRSQLPPAWLPTVEILEVLPVLTASGKVDRKALQGLAAAKYQTENVQVKVEDLGAVDIKMNLAVTAVTLAKGIGVALKSEDDNFFAAGGSSLTAAMMISELRRLGRLHNWPALQGISIRDLYDHLTMAELARTVLEKDEDELRSNPSGLWTPTVTKKIFGTERFYLVAFMQVVWILLEIHTWAMIAFYFIQIGYEYFAWKFEELGLLMFPILVVELGLALPLWIILQTTIVRILKLLLCERGRDCGVKLWSLYYFRWWLIKHMQGQIPARVLGGTPFASWWMWLMGAKMGKGVNIWTVPVQADMDLLTIGDGVTIGQDTFLNTSHATDGVVYFGAITLDAGVSLGCRVSVQSNSHVGSFATVDHLSLVTGEVPEGCRATGSPLRITKHPLVPKPLVRFRWPMYIGMVLVIGALSLAYFLPVAAMLIIFASSEPLKELFQDLSPILFALVLPTVLFLVVVFFIVLVAAKWLLVGRLQAGSFSINSLKYLRFWTMQGLISSIFMFMPAVMATIFFPPVLRLLGAKVGKHAEVSSIFAYTPDLLTLGDGVFCADHTCIGPVEIRHGECELKQTTLGSRVFIGNNAVVTAGSSLPDNVLIGVQSQTPQAATAGTSWLGAPPFEVFNRPVASADIRRTYKPPCYLKALRFFWEFTRLILPGGFTWVTFLIYWFGIVLCYETEVEREQGPKVWQGRGSDRIRVTTFEAVDESHDVEFWMSLGLWGYVCLAALLAMVLFGKWVLVGRYRPGQHPLYSSYVWRAELVEHFETDVALPAVLHVCLGTPLIGCWFILMGAKTHPYTFINTIFLTEADLISIGPGACVNRGVTIQSHLFEDRVMKMDKLVLKGCTSVGCDSVVLYSAFLMEGARLDPSSLCMKGEVLLCGRYEGIPANQTTFLHPLTLGEPPTPNQTM